VRLDGLHLKSIRKRSSSMPCWRRCSMPLETVRHLIMSSIDITERKRAENGRGNSRRNCRTWNGRGPWADGIGAGPRAAPAAGGDRELRQRLPDNARRGSNGVGERGRRVGRIATRPTRASEIIRRLRAMVKKQRPEGRPASANELVREAVSLLSFDLRQAGIEPALDLAGGLPQVWADAVQIQQVLVNLVHNAIEAMQSIEPATRSLVLATRGGEDGIVRVDVVDKGSGVPPEDLGSIFDSFFTTSHRAWEWAWHCAGPSSKTTAVTSARLSIRLGDDAFVHIEGDLKTAKSLKKALTGLTRTSLFL